MMETIKKTIKKTMMHVPFEDGAGEGDVGDDADELGHVEAHARLVVLVVEALRRLERHVGEAALEHRLVDLSRVQSPVAVLVSLCVRRACAMCACVCACAMCVCVCVRVCVCGGVRASARVLEERQGEGTSLKVCCMLSRNL
jgi:hypothetical protein